MAQKVAIVGAGPSGLAAACALKDLNISCDVFESHSKPGGCASYFRRGLPKNSPEDIDEKLLFDAGATVLWAMDEGDFLSNLLKKWKVESPVFHKHPFHRFTLGGQNFELDCRSDKLWISSLCSHFPEDAAFIRKHFTEFFKTARSLNKILYQIPAEPFLNLANVLLNAKFIKEAAALSSFFSYPRPFSKVITSCSLRFQEWVDMVLLITLQAKATEVESLYAASALCFFPLGAGSLEGGMASLFDALVKNLNQDSQRVFFKHEVTRIRKERDFTVLAGGKEFGPYSHILLTLPRWNSQNFFSEKLFEDSEKLKWENIEEHLWSALVGYLAIKDESSLPDCAYNHQLKTLDGDFYFSVSQRADLKRGPVKWRAVTVSTHEKLGKWDYPQYIKKKDFPGREHYEKQKGQWRDSIAQNAQHVFAKTPAFIEVATPKTFLHYTKRKAGFVGGIPLTQDFSFLKAPSQETLLSKVFQIGDTAFPGQSIVNCTVGALEAVRKITLTL